MKLIAPHDWRPRGIPDLEPAAWTAVRDLGNSIVVAGPGAGKTELLAQRASYLLETGLCPSPYRILAISFKKDAARNLKERVQERCGPDLARRFESYTFDAWSKGLLDRFRMALPPEYRPTADYVLDKDFAKERQLRERLLSVCAQAGVGAGKIQILEVEKFFGKWILGSGIDIESIAPLGGDLALTRVLWKSALHGASRSAIGFPMIAVLAELLLRTNPTLIKALRGTYKFVFLDEFQDTTGTQYRLLHTAFYGSPAVLTAVGDRKQRIMLWAGAEVGVFDTYSQNFGANQHGLIMNYRSAPKLVAIQQKIIASLEPGAAAPRSADTGETGEGECRLINFSTDAVEGEYLANLIEGWITRDGVKPEDICILTRQKPDVYTPYLRAELSKRNIRSRISIELQDLLADPLTAAVLDIFKLCVLRRAPSCWERSCALVLRMRGLDAEDKEAARAIKALSEFLNNIRPHLTAAVSDTALKALINSLLSFLGLEEFKRVNAQYLQQGYLDKITGEIAQNLEIYRAENPNWETALDAFEGKESIPIMSIHKSKGLEYHSVIVIGLEDYPFRNVLDKNREEDCTFFVAFSRAKKRVMFTASSLRNGRRQSRTNVARYDALLGSAGVTIESI